MNNKKTGEFISTTRKELGYSQKDLAEKLNITDKAVSKWETGRSAPDVSMLIPLAEVLGVSVTEILQGERISQEEIHTASNEMLVKTLKKSKSKIMVAIILCLVFLIGLICSYPAYHYFSTIPTDDFWKIESRAITSTQNEKLNFIATTDKSDKTAFLFSDGERSYMLLYERNELFPNRLEYVGMMGSAQEIGMYCMGTNGENIFVLFGACISEETTEYSFLYRDTEYTKHIRDGYVLDIFIDKDKSFTNPTIIS